MSKTTAVCADVLDAERKHKLRMEAAKRGMTISKYVSLLIEKATQNYSNFDIPGHEIKFKESK